MPTRIDHVITAAADLEALEATFRRLGFFVTGGGTHPHLGTSNRVVLLGEGYIELLAIADPARVSAGLKRRMASGEGWIGFALQSPDIVTEIAVMRERDAAVDGPNAGRLVAPDGAARGWRVATVYSADIWAAAEPLPLLIQHDSDGEAHRSALAGAGGDQPHANGALAIDEVVVATHDADALARQYAQAYGLAAEPRGHDATLQAAVLALPLPSGERIILARPTGPGLTRTRLTTAGDGLCRVSVRVADLGAAAATLRLADVPFVEVEGALQVAPEQAQGAALQFVASR